MAEYIKMLIKDVKSAVAQAPDLVEDLSACESGVKTLHLAVFIEPFLGWILDGTKTVESRFSVNRCAPYQKVRKGDLILLKKSGGAVVGIVKADSVWYYRLDNETLGEIKDKFAMAICAFEPSFWDARKNANYATLIKLGQVRHLSAMTLAKRDRRGWVVLKSEQNLTLEL